MSADYWKGKSLEGAIFISDKNINSSRSVKSVAHNESNNIHLNRVEKTSHLTEKVPHTKIRRSFNFRDIQITSKSVGLKISNHLELTKMNDEENTHL
ncbi:hypothetical protein [Cedecea sp. NFIX57]|uniref:hypothetical protein n=1 Tax=Cedecea sp. NFIX57 TaxID=1566286 RepID=UPI00111C10C9|nr:hypothetical protein [Cedecea sp. NFIX57]